MTLHGDSPIILPALSSELLLAPRHDVLLHVSRFLLQVGLVAGRDCLILRWPNDPTVLNVLQAGRGG